MQINSQFKEYALFIPTDSSLVDGQLGQWFVYPKDNVHSDRWSTLAEKGATLVIQKEAYEDLIEALQHYAYPEENNYPGSWIAKTILEKHGIKK